MRTWFDSTRFHFRNITQLGECLPYKQEAGGSNPPVPILFFNKNRGSYMTVGKTTWCGGGIGKRGQQGEDDLRVGTTR